MVLTLEVLAVVGLQSFKVPGSCDTALRRRRYIFQGSVLQEPLTFLLGAPHPPALLLTDWRERQPWGSLEICFCCQQSRRE